MVYAMFLTAGRGDLPDMIRLRSQRLPGELTGEYHGDTLTFVVWVEPKPLRSGNQALLGRFFELR